MSKGDPVPPVPSNAPQIGEVYSHYKGDIYLIVDMVFDASLQQWAVLYKPLYEGPVNLFTRPLAEWSEVVEWEGKQVARFVKV